MDKREYLVGKQLEIAFEFALMYDSFGDGIGMPLPILAYIGFQCVLDAPEQSEPIRSGTEAKEGQDVLIVQVFDGGLFQCHEVELGLVDIYGNNQFRVGS